MNIIGKTMLAASVVTALGIAIAIQAGFYNVAADAPHTRPVYALLETMRERSIAARADNLQIPADLGSTQRIEQGAGNYNAMCADCHLAPGMTDTELSKGLYPKPPNLSRELVQAGTAFWVIKHGIKASGMPAWGKSMDDGYIWNMAAFLQQLPKLDKTQYEALVANSGGHSHGGGETGEDHHDDGDAHAHVESMEMDAADHHEAVAPQVHAHADGKQHVHETKPDAVQSASADSPVEHEAAAHEHRH